MKRLSEMLKKFLTKCLLRVDYWIYFICFLGIGSGIIVAIITFKKLSPVASIIKTILYSFLLGYFCFAAICIFMVLVIVAIWLIASKDDSK